MQKHDTGYKKSVRNYTFNPIPLSQKERLKKRDHEQARHRSGKNRGCRLCYPNRRKKKAKI